MFVYHSAQTIWGDNKTNLKIAWADDSTDFKLTWYQDILTPNIPCFLDNELPLQVQKNIWDLPHVIMVFASVGWNSTASTTSFVVWNKTNNIYSDVLKLPLLETHVESQVSEQR